MASNIGPRFAIEAEAPPEWNRMLGEHEVVLKTAEAHEAFICTVYARAFREKLLLGGRRWVFLAQILREDAEEFYAFEEVAERALFIELRELDSVGPKTAALAVASLGKKGLLDMARGQGAAGFKIPGLGPKTLEKISLGLKAKAEKFLPLLTGLDFSAADAASTSPQARAAATPHLLLQAMEKLGLRPVDTIRVYQELLAEDDKVSELSNSELVRRTLQRWGQVRSLSSLEVKNSL